jgi:hypothetical protein
MVCSSTVSKPSQGRRLGSELEELVSWKSFWGGFPGGERGIRTGATVAAGRIQPAISRGAAKARSVAIPTSEDVPNKEYSHPEAQSRREHRFVLRGSATLGEIILFIFHGLPLVEFTATPRLRDSA